ncbi:MAG: hypothetical protein WD794_11560 [Mycobacteriales bacterium]
MDLPLTEQSELTRRALLRRGAALAALGATALSLPEVLYRTPWTGLAAAQTLPTTLATFTAAVEAVTGVPDEPAAAWIIREFDRALPPLPEQVAVTAAVAAVLDAHTVAGAHGPRFAQVSPDDRRAVLRAMVLGSEPDMRQIANQLIPFCAFAYWTDATLDEPATPDGPRLDRWREVGFPGPSHGYADSYTQGGPSGFAAMTDAEP